MLNEIALKRVNQAAQGAGPVGSTNHKNAATKTMLNINTTGGFGVTMQSKPMSFRPRAETQNRPPLIQNIPVISYNNAIIAGTTPRRSYNQVMQSSPFKRKVQRKTSFTDNFINGPAERNFSP